MVRVPSKCARCGLVFESRLIHLGANVRGVTLLGNRETCPQCGGIATVADGTYNSPHDKLELVAGPPSTRSLIAQLRKIAEEAQSKRLTADDILTQVADVNPDLAKKLKGLGSWPVYGLILLLFWLVKSFTLDLKVDLNYLIDQAWLIGHGQRPERYFDSEPPQFPQKPTPPRQAIESNPLGSQNRIARRRSAAKARRSKRLR